MTWSKKDKILFTIVNKFGKEHLEKQIKDASQKFSTLKKRPEFFTIFGYYNIDKNVFVWQNNMNKHILNFIKNGYMGLFGTDYTLKKLFQPTVAFNKEDMNVIPYLMEILHDQFTVVRFKSQTNYIYALTIVDGIKETFKYEDFDAAMFLYRKYDELDRGYKSKQEKYKK